MAVVCKLEEDLELARLETAFWESCQAVRASSVALHKIHAFLMKELLDLEADKRRALAQRIGQMESEVAEMKAMWQEEVCQLREQLQRAQREAPQQITPPSPRVDNPSTARPPRAIHVDTPSTFDCSPLPPPHDTHPSIVPRDDSSPRPETSLFPAPELVELSDIRTDTTSGEESGGLEAAQPATQQGRRAGRPRRVPPSRKKAAKSQDVQLDRVQGSTGEESDADCTVPSIRKRRKRLTNVTVASTNAGSQDNDRGGEGQYVAAAGLVSNRVNAAPAVREGKRGRPRGRPRGRGRSRGARSTIQSQPVSAIGGREGGEGVGVELLGRGESGAMAGPPQHIKEHIPRIEHQLDYQQGGVTDMECTTAVVGTGLAEVIVDRSCEGVGGEVGEGGSVVSNTPSRGRGRRKKGSNRGKQKRQREPQNQPVHAATTELSGDRVENPDIPIVVVTVPNTDAAPCSDDTCLAATNGEAVGADEGEVERERRCGERSTSPEIPLQNSQSTPEAAQMKGGGGGRGRRRGGRGQASSGGRLLERIVSSLVERSAQQGGGGGGGREAKKTKRKTLTAKKPSQKLSLVDSEEDHRARRKRMAVRVNTTGFTAPKLKARVANRTVM